MQHVALGFNDSVTVFARIKYRVLFGNSDGGEIRTTIESIIRLIRICMQYERSAVRSPVVRVPGAPPPLIISFAPTQLTQSMVV